MVEVKSRNKPRLQLALYVRPKHHDSYHYALFVSPKLSKEQHRNSATKHHVKNTLQNVSGELVQPWRYERFAISDIQLEPHLLVRIVIGKVTSSDALEKILEAVPVYQIDDPNQAEAKVFSCITWVQAAIEELRGQDVVSKIGEWEDIEKQALEYVKKKKDEKRWSVSWKGAPGVPTLDLLNGREIVA